MVEDPAWSPVQFRHYALGGWVGKRIPANPRTRTSRLLVLVFGWCISARAGDASKPSALQSREMEGGVAHSMNHLASLRQGTAEHKQQWHVSSGQSYVAFAHLTRRGGRLRLARTRQSRRRLC